MASNKKKSFILAAALILFLAFPGFAFIPHVVDAPGVLDTIANSVKTSVDPVHVITFKIYSNPGHFVLDGVNKADTVIFTRGDESDSVIDLTDSMPLFDIKRMKGTIILRNLAFRLMSPKAVLISGSDAARKNKNLTLDSCFVFGSNVNSTFITWLSENNGTVDVRRSFFNFANGWDTIDVNAGSFDFRNDVFNFAGLVNSKTLATYRLEHNTVSRTQFYADGSISKSEYKVLDNLFARHGHENFLLGGDTAYYPILLSNFSEISPSVKRNVEDTSWAAFEPAPGGRFTADSTNKRVAVTGKDSAVAWDWYHAYPNVGFDFGLDKAANPYNVFPGARTLVTTAPYGNALTLHFKPSLIPRRCLPQFAGPALGPLPNPALRLQWPGQQGLTLGDHVSFDLDSMVLGSVIGFGGSPILLAYKGSWTTPAQPEGAPIGRFVNRVPGATAFHPAFKCTTPRGPGVSPANTFPPDHLVFDTVDSAGSTTFTGFVALSAPDSLRYLKTDFGFTTTAVITKDSMEFGTSLGDPHDSASRPYRADKVFWYLPDDGRAMVPATQVDDSVFISKYKAAVTLKAYLVEKLTAKKGTHSFYFRNGWVTVKTKGGFQIDIDSASYLPDTSAFGSPSAALRFSWAGRTDSDTVEIHVKRQPAWDGFKDSAGTVLSAPFQNDTGGYVKLRLATSDSGKAFFLGIKYNVTANVPFAGTVDGVTVSDFVSSFSGKLSFRPVTSALYGTDSAFTDTRFLGGDSLETISIKTAASFAMSFQFTDTLSTPSALEIHAWDGHAWLPQLVDFELVNGKAGVLVHGVPKEVRALVAVERLKPADTYIQLDPPKTTSKGELLFRPIYKGNLNTKITSYDVEIRQVDVLGTVTTTLAGEKLIGDSVTVPFPKGTLATYRVIYYESKKPYGLQPTVPIAAASWDIDVVGKRIDDPIKFSDVWTMLGFPLGGTLGRALVRQAPFTLPDTVLDVRYLVRLKVSGGKPAWDTIPDQAADAMKINPGDAVMLGSTRQYKLTVDSTMTFLPAGEFATAPAADSGWKFIACPFPIPYRVANVKSNRAQGSFVSLDVTSVAKGRSYDWGFPDVLAPFRGYAYNFRKGEVLTFNPFAGVSSPKAAVSQARALEVRLTGDGGGFTRAWLTDSPLRPAIPFLAAPGGGLELRLGGGDGFLRKKLAGLDRVDEPLEAAAPAPVVASLSLRPSEGAPPVFQKLRLVDVTSGRVYEGSDLAALPLSKGRQSFRLLAGDAAFVEERTKLILASAPSDILLSQNFPNPARGRTRILLDWPAERGSERAAVLEVFDTRGRVVARLDLGRPAMGRQALDIDASTWSPGVYTYRLTVASAGQSVRLQKRMLVTQ